jgi:hypothetical protein
MSNLSAAFAGASQGLDQLASAEMQREMMQAQMMRAENLAYLRNYLTTHREVALTQVRGQMLEGVADHRAAAEHAARDEEIDRQEQGRSQNQAAAQRRQLIDTEAAQDNAFTNQGELQARAAGRMARVQASRNAVLQANQARQQKAAIRDWLGKYAAQSHGTLDPRLNQTDPFTAEQLTQFAQHDPVLKAQLLAYKDADAREQAANQAMGKFPSPYDTPSAPGAVAPANDSLASPPTSLIPIPSEGPGISDSPYPTPSAADEMWMSGSGSGGSSSSSDDDSGIDY